MRHKVVPLGGCACGSSSLSRRDALRGALVIGATMIAAPRFAIAQSPAIIDVHHHLTPPTFRSALLTNKLGERPIVDWTPQRSIEDMDKAGVATAITSVTTPGVWFGSNADARALARECNDYAARLAADYPGRFGIFASLPLPDIKASLKEIEYAFDVLKADGISVMTNVADKWLGDPVFEPVMAELNRRKAILYTHPSAAICCRNLLPDIHYSVVELATDTSRAIANLMFTGTADKFSDIVFIFSHAGGTMPFIYQRFTAYPVLDQRMGLGRDIAKHIPKGVLPTLKSFYYDTAQAAHPMAMTPLANLVGTSQILFGTDFPFRTSADHVKGLSECGFGEGELKAIYRENALRLLPGLSTR